MMEPRSFAEGRRVGEITTVDPTELTDREVAIAALLGVQQAHSCLEVHIKDQNKFNAQLTLDQVTATEKRQALADDVLDLKGSVLDIKSGLRELILSLGVQKPKAGETRSKAKADISWKALFKIASAVGGTLGLLIFLYQITRAIWPVVDAYLMSLSPT